MNDPVVFPLFIAAILIALTVHEWSHAFVATKLGDDTPSLNGRLTLNPIAHIDLLGAIMFILVQFGWAKPVPIDPRNFRHPTRDSALVALAGPFSNLVLAFIAAALISVLPVRAEDTMALQGMTGTAAAWNMLSIFLQLTIFINLALMAFNLLPIPPLDGSNMLRLFIPWQYRDQYEEIMRYGPWILLGVIVLERATNIPLISAWVGVITGLILELFGVIFG